jgi:hypothetical protein
MKPFPICLFLAAAVSVLLAPIAAAYTGGPTRVVDLGFDPPTQRVYFRTQAFDESDRPIRLAYFDLSKSGTDAVEIDLGSEQDADSAWTSIAARLQPLKAAKGYALQVDTQVDSIAASTDGLDIPVYRARYAIRLDGVERSWQQERCFDSASFHVRVYDVSGRRERVAVLVLDGRGYYCETYETAMLFPARQK